MGPTMPIESKSQAMSPSIGDDAQSEVVSKRGDPSGTVVRRKLNTIVSQAPISRSGESLARGARLIFNCAVENVLLIEYDRCHEPFVSPALNHPGSVRVRQRRITTTRICHTLHVFQSALLQGTDAMYELEVIRYTAVAR